MLTPRLIPLTEAKAYLGGRHPVSLGIAPVVRGLWDIKALDAWLDQRLTPKADAPSQGAANDQIDERAELAGRIADASRHP